MSNELTVSMSLKSGPGKTPYAAVEYNDGNETQTIIYKAGSKHLNEMFADVLNLAILKDIKSIAGNYDSINLHLNRNKFSKLIEEGKPLINERDIPTIKKSESIYYHLLDIRNMTTLNVSFEHANIANIYNEVLSYEKLADFNHKQNGVIFGDLVIAEGERFNAEKFIESAKKLKSDPAMNITEQHQKTVENNNLTPQTSQSNNNVLSAFIDVVKSENNDSLFYVGLAITKKEDKGNIPLLSHIVPVKAESKEEALAEQLKKAFFKGENKRQQSDIFGLVEKENGLNVYCTNENVNLIRSVISENFEDNFELNITGKLGDTIRNKIQQKIENDHGLKNVEENVDKQKYIASETYTDKHKMAIYISTSSNDIGQSYGVVIRSPASDEILYEIEGRVHGDVINDQTEREKYAANEALNYIARKVRNGHLPNDMNFEIRTSNLYLVSMLNENKSEIADLEKIKKDLKTQISYSWINDQHVDPYMACAKEVARNARKMIATTNIIQSVEFENKEVINSIKSSSDYTFNSNKKKAKLKM